MRTIPTLILVTLLLIFGIALYAGYLISTGKPNGTLAPESISIQALFATKVVYNAPPSGDVVPLEQDCDSRGGTFNTCGSVCDPAKEGVEACINVCAFTCELPDPNAPAQFEPEIVEMRLGETVVVLGVSITPKDVIEDSRCPLDVQCVQAGTVRVVTEAVSGLGTSTQPMTLNQPLTTEAEEIILVDVMPTPRAGIPVADEDYRFRFEVTKRSFDM